MPPLLHTLRRFITGCGAVFLTATIPVSRAQTTPQLEYLFPAGAQRGTTVEVQYGGDYMPGPCRLSSAGDGLSLQPTADAERYRFAVAPAAVVGSREIRLSSVQGASPPFRFMIGELPEVIHDEARERLELNLPVTANGRLESGGDVDEYLVTLAAGAQIVCGATTRAIRSPIDPMLRLLDADGKIVAESFPHRSADALLVFRAAQAGCYTLQLFDFDMGGGFDHVYRLTATVGPWLDYVFPAGLRRDAESAVTVYGWNLPGAKGESLSLKIAPQPSGRYELTVPGGVNHLALPVDEEPESIETEPNDVVEQALDISLPTTMNGRLNAPEDVDFFAFTAKKGERLSLDVDSADLQFPMDGVLSIVDAAGKSLLEADDVKASRDPSLKYTVPADGRYLVKLRERAGAGGADFVYRLHLTAPRPDVTARVNAASLMLHAGQTTNLPVLVERIDGLAEELEVTALDLPAGVTVAPQAVPAKTPGTVQLPFAVTDQTVPLSALIRIVVRRKVGGDFVERRAVIAESPAAMTTGDTLWLAVSPEIPFTLKTSITILDAPRLAAFPFPVAVERKAGFTEAIRLVGVEPDRRGTLRPLAGEIAANATSGTIPLVLQHKVTEGTTHRCRVMGVAEVPGLDGKMYAVFHIAAGSMSIGCQPNLLTMIATPSLVTWMPGTTQRVEVRLMRRTAMEPVTLRLKLPSGVLGLDCEPVEVDGKQDQAVLELRFAADAVLPPRTTIEIQAESAHDGLPIYAVTSLRLESQ